MTESEILKGSDDKNFEKLVCNNFALVHSIARRFTGRGAEYDDLVQIGSIGLINAAKRFDAELGYTFSTYATSLIMGEIRRFLRDDGIIKVSRHLKEVSFKANAHIKSFTEQNGREPTISELSDISGISAEEITSAFSASIKPHSIFKENEDGQTIADTLQAEGDFAEDIAKKSVIKKVLDALPHREQKILIMRYFKDKTQKETAEIIGISQVQVSRIEKKLLEKIRNEFLCDS